jgi:Polyketide cyclase / dehydrase and lipid transport
MRKLLLGDRIPVSAGAAWAVIGDFSGMQKWAPIVEAEATEVTPQGKMRTLTLRGGRTVKELMTSEGEHHYTYTLDRPDMVSYHSTVAVAPIDEGAAMIELSLVFEPAEGVDLTETTDQLLKFLSGNLKAMKRAVAA